LFLSQQTFWHICHNDSNQEDDGCKPMVAQDEGDDEKGNAKEDSNT
jgi:hypothetical protein